MKRIYIQRSGWGREQTGLIGIAIAFGHAVPFFYNRTGEIRTIRGMTLVIGLIFYAIRIRLFGELNEQ